MQCSATSGRQCATSESSNEPASGLPASSRPNGACARTKKCSKGHTASGFNRLGAVAIFSRATRGYFHPGDAWHRAYETRSIQKHPKSAAWKPTFPGSGAGNRKEARQVARLHPKQLSSPGDSAGQSPARPENQEIQ